MLSRRVVIIANGDLNDLVFYQDLVSEDDMILCVNGGTAHALDLGLKPDLVIGDLDSLQSTDRGKIDQMKVRFIKSPSEKDKSDLELAIDHAVGLNPEEILIIGALGGKRFDHAFINVLLLDIPLRKQIPARIIDENQEIFLARKEIVLSGDKGIYLSLFALTDKVSGIVTEGLKYPLNNESLYFASTRGLSNELTATEARVSFKSGLLLIVKTPAPAAVTGFTWPGH